MQFSFTICLVARTSTFRFTPIFVDPSVRRQGSGYGKVIMRKLTSLTILAATAMMLSAAGAHADNFYLHDSDTVVFLGDSITEGGAYTTAVEDYVVTRFPLSHIQFINSGVGKDTISGGLAGTMSERLRRDVATFQPTVVTMMFGMNDGRFRSFDPQIQADFILGYEAALKTLRTLVPTARVTLLRPSPYDDFTRADFHDDGYNAVLERYGESVALLATATRSQVVDMNTPVADDLRRLSGIQSDGARRLFPDRIHPSSAGGLLLAGALLKGWGATPVVSAVDIDASKRTVVTSIHAQIRNMSDVGVMTWEQLDDALPMPLPDDPQLRLVLDHTDFISSLDQQFLTVTGLPDRRFRLSIDGQAVAIFDGVDLSRGVNLALYSTPMAQQSTDVHMLSLAKNSVRATRWRRVQMLKTIANSKQLPLALSDLDNAEAAIVLVRREAAAPRWHRFELVPM